MLINPRTLAAFLYDVVAAALAWWFAFWLRFNLETPQFFIEVFWHTVVWVVPVQTAIFWYFGLYRGIWCYASVPDLKRIAMAVLLAAVALPTLFFMLRIPVPRSVLILDPILLVIVMGGARIAYRVWKEQRVDALLAGKREPVFVLGAGEEAANLVIELARSNEWRVVGMFDQNPGREGRELQGVSVLGRFDTLPQWAQRLGVQHAIIAMPAASHELRRRAMEICTAAGIKAMTVPSFDDLISGKVTVSQIRSIELDDLLGRDPVVLDTAGLSDWISGHVVMVTGAGGSIGAELCRQAARFKPRMLILFELNEYALYSIEQEFEQRYAGLPIVCAIGDVKNRARLEQLLSSYRPTVIFHAAAYKHVPLMEQENAWEAVLNNVLGTSVLAEAAAAHGVEKFVLISTDKAVNPTNVMGASKRLAEMVCQALQRDCATRFVMVRFGNVLGSTGSVIPKFRSQIAQGGPLTVTHPEVTRYFMSIPEASQLVLQAGLMGKGGEIMVLDMGEPVRIADLARDVIRLSGFAEDDIDIVFTGLRPGEKLFEELLADDENMLRTPHPKLRIAKARQEDRAWLQRLLAWLSRPAPLTDDEVKRELTHWVSEYRREPHEAALQKLASG